MAITLRPNEAQLAQLELLKTATHKNTSSGALLEAARKYPSLEANYRVAQNEIQRLEQKLRSLKRSIRNYDQAKKELLELAED